MLIRIAAVFAGLCALGMVPLASGQTYAGTLTRYHFLIESGCGTLSTTTADYPPSQTEFGPFQVSCNGYTIVVRALKPGFDKTITATVGVGRIGWDVSPPVNENTSFSVDFTAAPGATKPKSGPFASSFATTSTSCKSAEWWKDFFSGSLTSQETVQCAETFMQISGPASASPTEGHVGMTVGAYFAGSGAPGISVGFDAYYSFAPAVPPVKVDRVEVVQVVQDSGNNIELVADKSAEVLVFVKTKDDQPRSVEATLSAPGRSNTIQKTQIANVKTGESVDFMVDGPWVSVGNAVFNVDLKDVSTSATYSYRTDADFKENDWPKPFIVVPLLVCETNPPPKTCADAKNIVDASSFMQKIFPVADRGGVPWCALHGA